jgi:serine protease Do
MRLRILRAALLACALALPAVLAPHAIAAGTPESFADLAATLSPAVVNVSSSTSSHQTADASPGMPDMPFPPGSPFEKFFKDFLDRNRPGQQGPGRHPTPGGPDAGPGQGGHAISLGSGFIIDPAGYIVTNNHVIDGADEISVTLTDNTTLKATLVGKDERVDLALLKVTTDKKLTAVNFGDSDTGRVGDWVLAIGNPFGLGGSVTAGIISARGRDIRQGPYDDFIQTDAAINRGNSGGPLFNMKGEVIGINTAIYSPSGGSVGIGFSVPANLAKPVIMQLREYGHARRGFLGVSIQPVTPDIAESLGLHDPAGALVGRVTEGGPAEAAGIKGGDIILKFNGQDLKDVRTLQRVVAETPIGKQVPVVLWRDSKEVTVQASVGELPDDIQQASATPTPEKPKPNPTVAISGLGAKLSPITNDLRTQFKLGADQKGVVVTDVDSDGFGATKGLKPGDVIVEVQQQSVTTPKDVVDLMEKYRKLSRKTVLMLVQSGTGMQWVAVPLAADTTRKPG